MPGTKTNTADVMFADDINGAGLVETLVELSPSISTSGLPVLFLTNDIMVATVGENYERLAHLYRLSWGESRNAILPLLSKEGVDSRCQSKELRYPKTITIRDGLAAKKVNRELPFPLIFKPDKPVSSYKTIVVENEDQLERSIPTIETALPSIAQKFIPGDDFEIRFAALYLNCGEVAARFEGRKLRSRPMGHTSVAISERNDEIHDLARKFFDSLQLTGPVSLEAKLGPDSGLWIIEPTVGRTDFWVGLCINDGIDLPLIEYKSICGQRLETRTQNESTLWINGDRDPFALAWVAFKYPEYARRMRVVGVFIDLTDLLPFVYWAAAFLRALPVRAARKLVKTFRSVIGGQNS